MSKGALLDTKHLPLRISEKLGFISLFSPEINFFMFIPPSQINSALNLLSIIFFIFIECIFRVKCLFLLVENIDISFSLYTFSNFFII